MRRSSILFVVLLAVFWQSVALARAGSMAETLADIEHAALHWQHEGHHHHEDGSYHLDDSNESVQHAIGDHAAATVALLVTSLHDVPPLGSGAPGGLQKAAAPDPALEGLLRPPRSRS